ncbi:hypothetical protein [Bradyrhizobium sp. JYMT SZCCT0428]|uniref:hypothetical protein n=1 Tax=Bradyrhizobium sp. JYMT SZCCT0428 TaxID=2807673 RepID=UPI001BA79D6F|nr:hypothetical protein [Bradyrhizobium sp. JYMT SZCCT0428]MBR1155288.1 hypothetical protein [Bradyrhizobium sp. JYMT SZCCT0428]
MAIAVQRATRHAVIRREKLVGKVLDLVRGSIVDPRPKHSSSNRGICVTRESHMHLIGNMDGVLAVAVLRIAQKVVLARNIGKYSLMLQQTNEGLSLQARRMTDDDLGVAFAADSRAGSVFTEASARWECEVTIYSGKN